MNHLITVELQKFVVENFLLGQPEETLAEDSSFLENGIIDSTGILELIGFVERTFNLHMEDDDLVPANLDSLRKLTLFIERKRAAATKEASA